jgi:excisionase family DNA binding protein
MQYVKEKREATDEPAPRVRRSVGGQVATRVAPPRTHSEPQAEAAEPVAAGPAVDTELPAAPELMRAARSARPVPAEEPSAFEMSRQQALEQLEQWRTRQGRLPLDIAEPPPRRRAPRSVEETREELIERLLDPQLSLRDVAKLLDVCPTTVRRYTNRGVLSHYRTPGNQRRFRLSDVLEFMRRQQEQH